MVEATFAAIKVQDALLLEVKVNALFLRPRKQMLASGHRHACGRYGVALVVRHGGNELGKPRQLVPGRCRVDQLRRIAFEHPLQRFERGGPVGPHLGVRGRKLTAVGERGFHRRVAMTLEFNFNATETNMLD